MRDTVEINVLAYQTGGVWIAQGIEYDIAAHADDFEALPAAFKDVLNATIFGNIKHGLEPLEGYGPAPAKFRALFRRSQKAATPALHAIKAKGLTIEARFAEAA